MRFVYATPDHARASAKEMRKVLAAYGLDASLVDCQAALAKGLGYETWAELKLAAGRPGRVPSPFDADAAPGEAEARAAAQARVIAAGFGLAPGYAEGVVRAVAATSGGREPPVAYDLRIGDPARPGKEHAATLVRDVPRIEGLSQVGTYVGGVHGDRRYTAIHADGAGGLWTAIGHHGNRYLDTVETLGGYTGFLLQGARTNELAGCGNAIPDLQGEHLLARLRLLLDTVLPKFAWSAEHGLMHPVAPHYRVRAVAGAPAVTAVVGLPPPTDLPNRYGTLAEAKEALVAIWLAKHADDPLIAVEGRFDIDPAYLVGTSPADIVGGMCAAYAVEARFLPPGPAGAVERFVAGMLARERHDAEAIMEFVDFEKGLCAVEPGFVPATSDGQATRGAMAVRGIVAKIAEHGAGTARRLM